MKYLINNEEVTKSTFDKACKCYGCERCGGHLTHWKRVDRMYCESCGASLEKKKRYVTD